MRFSGISPRLAIVRHSDLPVRKRKRFYSAGLDRRERGLWRGFLRWGRRLRGGFALRLHWRFNNEAMNVSFKAGSASLGVLVDECVETKAGAFEWKEFFDLRIY
jgi:hypothetical protein